jgi:hypothetical protein
MINSELLKEAIADAKAVRATALANAKAALEESFKKRFEAVFADGLKQGVTEEEEQEEEMDEVSAPNQVSGKGGEAKGPKTKDVSKGQPKKGSAAKKDFKTIAIGGSEGAAGSKAPAAKQSIVTEEEEEEEEGKMDEQYEEEEEGKMDESGLTAEDLDEIIKELEGTVADEAKGEPVDPTAEVPGEVPAGIPGEEDAAGAMPPMGGDDEAGEEDGEAIPHAEPDGDEGLPPEAGGEEVPGEEPPVGIPGAEQPQIPQKGEEDEINLEELIAALNEEEEEDEEEEKEEMDEITNEGVPTNVSGQDKSGGTCGYPKASQDASKKQVKGKNHNISGKGNIGSGSDTGKPTMQEVEVALNESYRTIEFLRGQINEVNLLNAKLLYTNKLFKEFSTNLDDAYRMKIVEAFDLTKSVREVKLAYALLAESLNFGVKGMRKTAAPVKKVATSNTIKQITEGMASKPVASTKPSKELISEGVSEMAVRFKQLANIKPAIIKENKK